MILSEKQKTRQFAGFLLSGVIPLMVVTSTGRCNTLVYVLLFIVVTLAALYH